MVENGGQFIKVSSGQLLRVRVGRLPRVCVGRSPRVRVARLLRVCVRRLSCMCVGFVNPELHTYVHCVHTVLQSFNFPVKAGLHTWLQES